MNNVNISEIIVIYFSGVHQEPIRTHQESPQNHTILCNSCWWFLIGSYRVQGGSCFIKAVSVGPTVACTHFYSLSDISKYRLETPA